MRSAVFHPAVLVCRAAAAVLGLACAGCDSHEEDAAPAAAPAVVVSRPVRREVTDWDEFTGRFVGTERVELRARVSGHFDAVAFTDGQQVRRGDLLFRIDRRPFAAAAAEAEARLTAAREFERTTDLLKYPRGVRSQPRTAPARAGSGAGAGRAVRSRTRAGPARP